MSYVVLDLEWNQAMRADSAVFNHLPIRLSGEIIEIGAVKLNTDLTLGEEFTIDVRPVYFRQIHYKVKKITGFDKERLSHGVSFPEALQQLREFCGEDVTFLTWGNDDRGVLEQNIIIHDLDWDWIADWINLQLIYNVQTGGDKNQKSLADAMAHFDIEQTRIAHDALGDAYNTALVCTHLDMKEGLRTYDDAPRILASRMPHAKSASETEAAGPDPVMHDAYDGFDTKAAALADERIADLGCLECGKAMQKQKWINQGDGRYMNVYTCEDGNRYLSRVRFKKDNMYGLIASRLVYECDEEMLAFYKSKAAQVRRRGRTHKQRTASIRKKQQQ